MKRFTLSHLLTLTTATAFASWLASAGLESEGWLWVGVVCVLGIQGAGAASEAGGTG